MRRETPIEWLQALERAGLHSARDLARELEVSPQTATRLIHGEHTSRETIEAAAVLLGVTPEDIRAMRQEVALPPFRLPAEADQLTPRERAAIVAVVRAMLESSHGTATTQEDAAKHRRALASKLDNAPGEDEGPKRASDPSSTPKRRSSDVG